METSVLETILIPWWKFPIYIAIATIGMVVIRISIKFDVNAWLKTRKESKELNDRKKASIKCRHIWTLYADSPHSRCNKCLVLISTSTLFTARAYLDPKPVISGQITGRMINPGQNELQTSDYIGASK